MKTNILAATAVVIGVLATYQANANTVTFSGATATFYQTFNGEWLPSLMIDGIISPSGNGWAIYRDIPGRADVAAKKGQANFKDNSRRLTVRKTILGAIRHRVENVNPVNGRKAVLSNYRSFYQQLSVTDSGRR
jgi:hypothetical protein